MGCVYIGICLKSGKPYIGKTVKHLKYRMDRHLCDAIDGSSFPLHRAIRKYGWKNFIWSVVFEHDDPAKLVEMEIHYIKTLGTKVPLGYNVTDGGDGFRGVSWSAKRKKELGDRCRGKPLSEETKKKLSAAMMGRVSHNKGKPMAESTKEKLRQINLGRVQSEETRKKLSEHFRGRPSPMKGRTLSAETRKKISEALKGLVRGPFTKEHVRKMMESRSRTYAERRRLGIKTPRADQRGEKNGNRKLTRKQVEYIRRTHKKGNGWKYKGNTRQLADRFGVTTAAILQIARGTRWSND